MSGFILGGGNALLSGGNFWDSALTGLWQGAASGAVLGGISGGASAHKNGQNYWTGNPHVTSNGPQPLMTEPDAMAVLPNNDDIGHTTELLRKTDSWELIENRAINRISSDCNSAIILRPNAKQYDPSLIKTNPNHTFPVVFDDDIIEVSDVNKNSQPWKYL